MREADLKSCWQQAEMESSQLSIDQLQHEAAAFHRRARAGDLTEYFGCACVVLIFGSFFWTFPNTLAKIGSLLMILVTLFVAYQLRKHRAARMCSPEVAATSLLDFHRTELERRRNMLRDSWKLFIAPLVLGLVVFAACLAPHHPLDRLPLLMLCGVVIAMGVVMSLYNRRQAGELQREIDELNSFRYR